MFNALLMSGSIWENQWVQIGMAVVLGFAAFALFLLTRKSASKLSTRSIVYGGIVVALAAILNLFKLKTGALMGGISGSVTLLRMFPIILYAVVFGPVKGLLVAVAYGLVDMLFGLDASGGVVQVLLDYIVAFGLVGLAGLATKSKQPYILGTLIALAGRFSASFLSGAVFFGISAPEGMNVWLYSLLYQCVTVLPDMLLVLIVFALVQNSSSFKRLVAVMKGEETGSEA